MKSELKMAKSTKAVQSKNSQPFEPRTDDVNRVKPNSARHSDASGSSQAKAKNGVKQTTQKSSSFHGGSDTKLSASDDTEFFECASEGNRSVEAHKVAEMSAKMSSKPELPKKKETPVAIINIPIRQDNVKTVMFNEIVHTQESSRGNTNTSSSTSFEATPKRAKSEAHRDQSNLMTVLHLARKNLFRTRRLSPHKLDAQIRQRQERAENLRQSILTTRKEYLEKVRLRQLEAKARIQEQNQIKNDAMLQDILDKQVQAAERQKTQIQSVVEKAKAENVKFEETNYINKMTKMNMLLDLEYKMSETQERRLAALQQYVDKQRAIGRRREEVDRRRRQLSEETKTKFLTNEQKREQAEQRRRQKIAADKIKAREDKVKRDLVRARKCFNFNKINEIMNFVNDSESLWELIAIEQDIENLGMHSKLNTSDLFSRTPVLMKAYDAFEEQNGDQHSRDLLRILHRDQFELEKLILKRDSEILNRCIQVDDKGEIKIRESPLQLMQQASANAEQSQSGSEERKSDRRPKHRILSNAAQSAKQIKEPRIFSDEYFDAKLQQQRLRMSMRRNILRRTLSEDLQWADCIKNDPSFQTLQGLAQMNQQHWVQFKSGSRLRSTSERRLPNLSPSPLAKGTPSQLKSQSKPQVSQPKGFEGTPKHASKKHVKNKKKHQVSSSQITVLSQALKCENNEQTRPDFGKCFRCFKRSDLQEIPRPALFTGKKERRPSDEVMSTLNPQSLGQLGPVQKMTFNGFLIHRDLQIQTQFGGPYSQTGSGQQSPQESDHHYSNSLLQMNQLIMNQKPLPANKQMSGILSTTNLSKNAQLYLFPIRDQKLLFMSKEKHSTFVNVQFSLKVCEVKNPPILPIKQKSTEVSETANNFTPTKSKTDEKPAQKTTPKKDGKEEKKESKLQTKKSFGRKSDILSGPHQMHQGDEFREISADDSLIDDPGVDMEKESRQIVDYLIKHVLIDCQKEIKQNDSQKSIMLDFHDSQKVVGFLEQQELTFYYCRLCEGLVVDLFGKSQEEAKNAITDHFGSKAHVRIREENGIKEVEDLCFSMLMVTSAPGDIAEEVRKEKEKALKRQAARLKKQIQESSVAHENASTYPGKELQSTHKKRLQIRCIELEKSVFPSIQNYDTVEAILNDVIKVMDLKKLADLHLMRKLKFIPTLIDMCKRISMCPRQELKHLGKALGLVIKIIQQFCSLRENRNYMLQTNRLMPLIELFNWCLNKSTEIFFGIDFLPNLFNILTSHLRHRVPYECQQLKELTVDYLISSTITAKLKTKHAIIKQLPFNELQEKMAQIPFFLLKSTTFLEALTAMIAIDARTRPVYEKSYKIGEHVFFVLQQTELFGIIQMITTLLLTCNETFKTSAPQSTQTAILPQTVLSLAIVSVKLLNNIQRMDFKLVHQMMAAQDEQLYFLLNFLLSYAEANIDQNDDVKELLHETLLFIGYFSLLNTENQNLLQRGENCIIKKLCNLPFTYFFDKRLKDILFPTLICTTFQNQRSLAIVDQEIDLDTIVKYLETNIEEELPQIIELEQEQLSEHTKSLGSFDPEKRSRAKSPSASSISSNSNYSVNMDFLSGNNPYLPLSMRFPRRMLREAAKFFSKMN